MLMFLLPNLFSFGIEVDNMIAKRNAGYFEVVSINEFTHRLLLSLADIGMSSLMDMWVSSP